MDEPETEPLKNKYPEPEPEKKKNNKINIYYQLLCAMDFQINNS